MYSCECSYLVSDQHDLHKTDVVFGYITFRYAVKMREHVLYL